jgi:hypothetical protein
LIRDVTPGLTIAPASPNAPLSLKMRTRHGGIFPEEVAAVGGFWRERCLVVGYRPFNALQKAGLSIK